MGTLHYRVHTGLDGTGLEYCYTLIPSLPCLIFNQPHTALHLPPLASNHVLDAHEQDLVWNSSPYLNALLEVYVFSHNLRSLNNRSPVVYKLLSRTFKLTLSGGYISEKSLKGEIIQIYNNSILYSAQSTYTSHIHLFIDFQNP